jgi:hypothetical protein
MTEGSIESPDTSSATVPTGPALQDALSAYPISLSPAMGRAVSVNSKEPSPIMDNVTYLFLFRSFWVALFIYICAPLSYSV